MPDFGIRLEQQDPRNEGIVRYFRRNFGRWVPCESPASVANPYMQCGSHPDIVIRLWNELAAVLPQDCRAILFGTPALVTPSSGIVLAAAWGTQYILRLPEQAMTEAKQAGARTIVRWSFGSETDIQREIGSDWIFGAWLKQEPDWLLALYTSYEGHANL